MILLISSSQCGAEKPAWGLPTLPNCLFTLGHILSLTPKFNYRNHSSRLQRSPGHCLGASRVYLLPDGAFPAHSAGRQVGWVWADPEAQGLAVALGAPNRTCFHFLICKMMMGKDKDL